MFIKILKSCKSGNSFKKDFSSKYAIYDDTIKEYEKFSNDISPQIMRNFIQSASPKISRQQNYMGKIANILKSSVPHFKKNANYYASHQVFSQILGLYQSMNIYRKEIFDLAQRNYNHFSRFSLLNLLQTYYCIVDLHHQSNPNFKSRLKKYLHQQLTNQSFSEKYSFKTSHFQCSIKALKFMLMDRELNFFECQTLIKFIETKIIPSLANVSLIDRNIGQILALVKELIQLHKLKVGSEIFRNLLQCAIKYQISQKLQSDNSVIKKENYQISLYQKADQAKEIPLVSKNTRIINHGQSSVFETVFARILNEKGYDFQKNIFIGMFQYDLLVKGKRFQIYRPFQKVIESQFNAISSTEWQNYKRMNDFGRITVDEMFENSIVLNLNGPYHYIDSDVYGKERVTRTQETKGRILKNYGYKKFNTVNYAKWEEIHEKSIHVQKYLDKILSQNMLRES